MIGCTRSKNSYRSKYSDEWVETANYIATPGKGILATDESTGTIGKHLVENECGVCRGNQRQTRKQRVQNLEEKHIVSLPSGDNSCPQMASTHCTMAPELQRAPWKRLFRSENQ
jgi:hypothetical protein